jgi:vacuolar protein-sorting-associated protein 4
MMQPRPRITKEWTTVPAVPVPPSRSIATRRTTEVEEQENLTARLESELRQLRAKQGDNGRGANAMERVKEASKKANAETEGEGDDKDDLSKLKEELQRTRVDFSKMRRHVGFDDVIGLDAAKRALREAVIWPAVADASLFSGIRSSPGGLLLYGPPGCGKTMIARAAASELSERAAFFHVRPADVMSKFYGDSQRRILAMEELVAEAKPAVVFFDEVDSLLGGRDGSNVAEHHRATTNALLAWMDGFGAGSEQVFFLGATNRAEAIDEAALRRFGEAVEVEAPCHEARFELLRHLCCDKAAADGHLAEVSLEDLNTIAERTDGYSLADVDRLVRRAFLQVMRELPGGIRVGLLPSDLPPVRLQHFESALQETTGTSALRKMLKERGKTRAQL